MWVLQMSKFFIWNYATLECRYKIVTVMDTN